MNAAVPIGKTSTLAMFFMRIPARAGSQRRERNNGANNQKAMIIWDFGERIDLKLDQFVKRADSASRDSVRARCAIPRPPVGDHGVSME